MLTEREEMIVAWLRRQNGDPDSPLYGDNCDGIADAIERGAHLKRPDPTIAAETWMKEGNVG